MNLLITTGIYPPKIGGPAQYAKNLKEQFEGMSHKTVVKTFGIENHLPTGIRHIFFFFKMLPSFLVSDMVFALDTYSVGFPTVFAGKIFRKKVVIRTGGDFLWEQYVERTKKKVLLRNFYDTEKANFSLKDKIIFGITKFTLRNSFVVFSTQWQRDIFVKAYGMDVSKTAIVENYYGDKENYSVSINKEFVASTRKLVWKNIGVLNKIFQSVGGDVKLFSDTLVYEDLLERIKGSYAVVLVSLGDISPNMILDAIRMNKPFICTREIGIVDRIGSIGIYVDPLSEDDITNAVKKLLDPVEYEKEVEKIRNFNFTHSWDQISSELVGIYNSNTL